MAIRDAIIALIVFGALPMILVRPYVGIYMWAWLSYMNPHRLSWGFAYDFPFAQAVALVLLPAALFSNDRRAIPFHAISVIWILFILWICFTTLFALNPEEAVPGWSQAIKIQILALLTVVLIHRKKVLYTFLWIVTISIIFYGVKGAMFVAQGGVGQVFGPRDSYFEDNNALALTLLMVLPLFVFLIRSITRVRLGSVTIPAGLVRKSMWLFATLALISVVFSYSRGAFVTITAMIGLALVKLNHRVLLSVLVIIALPILFVYVPDEWFDRMGTIKTYEEDSSAMGRVNAWSFAYNIANERPFVGGGFDVFTPSLFKEYAPDPDDFNDAHSIYFEVLGEHGYIGLILFLLLGYSVYRMAGRLAKTFRRDHPVWSEEAWIGDLAVALQFSLAAYAVGGAFLGLAYFDLYYHMVGTVLILHRYANDLVPGTGWLQTERASRAISGFELQVGRQNMKPAP
jgi:putative inorganic carbon (hco3(-)) transporter